MNLRVLVAVSCLIAVLGAVAAYTASKALEPVAPSDESTRLFFIESGQGLNQIARKLEQDGLVRDARAVRVLARYRGDDRKLQVGEYEVSVSWSTSTILDRLTSGRGKTSALVFPEGTPPSGVGGGQEAPGVPPAEGFPPGASGAGLAQAPGLVGARLEG
ncbi:MAG: endolytic transglycosylase MltG, partial [Proteobacteria bacterium]|nr:endolytic transglycosylase MltG [Pseudomonadota bacterium]